MHFDRRGLSTMAVVGALVAGVAVAGVAYLLYSPVGGGGSSTPSTSPASSSSASTSTGSYRVVLQLQPSTPLASSVIVANYTLKVTILGTLSSPLVVEASGPAGVTVQASPAQIQPGSGSDAVAISFKVAGSVAAGTYPFNVTVSSSGLTSSQKFSLMVVKYLVATEGTSYVPNKLSVPVGSTVYWVRLNGAIDQYDNGDHNVVFDNTGVSSPTLGQYQSWSYTFTQAGSFSYHCTFHPGMAGEVTVA